MWEAVVVLTATTAKKSKVIGALIASVNDDVVGRLAPWRKVKRVPTATQPMHPRAQKLLGPHHLHTSN